jgi:TonB family protein
MRILAIARVAAALAACVIWFTSAAHAEPAPRVNQVKDPVVRDKRGSAVFRANYAPMPHYPFKMRLHHEEGRGMYVLLLRPNGTVSGVAVARSAGLEELDIAAAQALIRWRFPAPPAGVRGVRIPIDFRLKTRFNGGTILR